jgi:outer membrane protein assembly factor BamA
VNVLFSLLLAAALAAGAQTPDRIAAIQVQGNSLTDDAEVIRLSGLEVGAPVDGTTVDTAAERLRAAKKFKSVEVLRRFASIADPTQILFVIIVDEGPVRIRTDGENAARVERRHGPQFMFLPLFRFEDGYGFSYGVESAIPRPAGPGSRLAFPATWGGERRAGVTFEKDLRNTLFSRASVGADVTRRINPYFEESDLRGRSWLRGERDVAKALRVGANAGWQYISFMDETTRLASTGVDVVYDTRIDPMLARNAVYARAVWEYLGFDDRADATRYELDGRGYLGLIGQSVLAVRGFRQDASQPLPGYLKPLLGGTANLRGFEAGTAAGDTLVAGSVELRVPLTSPLSFGKLGLSAFIDVATVYDKGASLGDQDFERGVGGGVWFSAALLRLNVYVAHGINGSTRGHFGASVLF